MAIAATKTKAFSKTAAYQELLKECQMNRTLYAGYSKHRSYASLKQHMDDCVHLSEYEELQPESAPQQAEPPVEVDLTVIQESPREFIAVNLPKIYVPPTTMWNRFKKSVEQTARNTKWFCIGFVEGLKKSTSRG